MDITITGRHQALDERVRNYIVEKLQKILRLHERLTKAHVTLDHSHGRHQAEIVVVGARGATFSVHSEEDDLRRTIDVAESKLEHQIRAWKSKITDHRPT